MAYVIKVWKNPRKMHVFMITNNGPSFFEEAGRDFFAASVLVRFDLFNYMEKSHTHQIESIYRRH